MIECLRCGHPIDAIPCAECAADGWEDGCSPRCEHYKPCECEEAAADAIGQAMNEGYPDYLDDADERAARRDQARQKARHGMKVDGAALRTFGGGGRRTS